MRKAARAILAVLLFILYFFGMGIAAFFIVFSASLRVKRRKVISSSFWEAPEECGTDIEEYLRQS